MQKMLGWIMVICAALIVLYNVVQSNENKRQVNEHPFLTIFSSGENLEPAYTFMPPYTGFEIVVLAVIGVGGILIFTSQRSPSA